VAIRRIMSANAHMPNCSLRHELLDDLEIRFRSINTSTPSQVSFLPVPGGTSENQIYGRTYCRSRCLSSPKRRLISKRFAGRRFEFFQSHRPKIVASCVPVESSAHPRCGPRGHFGDCVWITGQPEVIHMSDKGGYRRSGFQTTGKAPTGNS